MMLVLLMKILMSIVRSVTAQILTGLTMIQTQPKVVRTVKSIAALGVM